MARYLAIPDNLSVSPLWQIHNTLFRHGITAGLGSASGSDWLIFLLEHQYDWFFLIGNTEVTRDC